MRYFLSSRWGWMFRCSDNDTIKSVQDLLALSYAVTHKLSMTVFTFLGFTLWLTHRFKVLDGCSWFWLWYNWVEKYLVSLGSRRLRAVSESNVPSRTTCNKESNLTLAPSLRTDNGERVRQQNRHWEAYQWVLERRNIPTKIFHSEPVRKGTSKFPEE